jgi:hypothetical protein
VKLNRVPGAVSQILDLFVQDATVSTGAGLANVAGSSVSFAWWHDSQASASTGTASTAGAMGTYSTSAWVQVSSTNALGWYQFGAPNGVFAVGQSAALHFYGAPSMAALPVEIDLNSQVNVTQIQGSGAVTSAAGTLNVSTQAIDKTGYNATTTVNLDKAGYTASSDIRTIYGSAAVTSAAGILNVSTQAIDKTGYSLGGTTMANVMQIYSQPVVTSAAGIFNVSTQALSYAVNVTSIVGTAAVTSAGGTLNVSTQAIDKTGYTVSTVQDKTGYNATTTVNLDKTAYSLTAAEEANIAKTVLTTTMTEGFRASSAAGSVIQLQYEILANLIEASNSGTTRTLGSVTSHALGSIQYQYDSTVPSSITRIA